MSDRAQETWRSKASDLFPSVRGELADEGFNTYDLFFELLSMSREAHRRRDDAALDAIYGFADWCMRQPEPELWNAAGVSFFEHLFDDRSLWPDVAARLTTAQVREHWGLWEHRLGARQMAEIRKLLGHRAP